MTVISGLTLLLLLPPLLLLLLLLPLLLELVSLSHYLYSDRLAIAQCHPVMTGISIRLKPHFLLTSLV